MVEAASPIASQFSPAIATKQNNFKPTILIF